MTELNGGVEDLQIEILSVSGLKMRMHGVILCSDDIYIVICSIYTRIYLLITSFIPLNNIIVCID